MPYFLPDIRPGREFGQQNVGSSEPVGIGRHLYKDM